MKKLLIGAAGAAVLFLGATGFAAADDGSTFVCPVLSGEAGVNGSDSTPFVQIAGDDYTIIGPDVMVPVHATNDDGAGSPGGAHAGPGDANYSPIWATP